ncbi:UNVERIFIED_CONTAM: hypothetical protein Sradi_5410400 [Sesamum radiatum]|uniref:Uncharacterized protein n=1 Tax=Sesamum radiatum TaxID=300843 RepID=A0AAW2LA76_SESRA
MVRQLGKDLSHCREDLKVASAEQVKWKDNFHREVASGQTFFKSDAGKIYLDCVWSVSKEKYEASDEFDQAVPGKANEIYDQMIRQCPTILRGCSHFNNEDFRFLDSKIPNDDGHEDGDVEMVDVTARGDTQDNGSEVLISKVDKT